MLQSTFTILRSPGVANLKQVMILRPEGTTWLIGMNLQAQIFWGKAFNTFKCQQQNLKLNRNGTGIQ